MRRTTAAWRPHSAASRRAHEHAPASHEDALKQALVDLSPDPDMFQRPATDAGFDAAAAMVRRLYADVELHAEMGAMGKDPKTSLLNGFNQLHACKNVFVTDGSCMTSTSTQNPSLTYMALTARAAAFAVEELKKQNL